MKKTAPLLLIHIRQLLTLRGPNTGPRRGAHLRDVGLIEDGAVLCAGGKVVAVGRTKDALRDPFYKDHKKRIRVLDCYGKVVLPGFVDSHTHPVFAGPRLIDFEKRTSGAAYEEIAEAGGGIRASIEGVRRATKSALVTKVVAAFEEMARQGTTTVEAKTGYGLSFESEMKSLEVIRDVARRWPGTVVPTLLGAHAVPPEFKQRPAAYVREVCEKMIPAAAKRKLAAFVDVYCDRGAFTAAETQGMFEAAARHGLPVRAHMCQLSMTELWPFLRFQPASFDHMDHVAEDDIPQLVKRDTVATFVPGANYFLGLNRYADARRLIDAGVPVALATDYNPGTSPTPSMPFVLSLACTHMKMAPTEAVAAATINGAWALRLAGRKGSIEPGKDADLTIFDVDDYREIAYWFGMNRCEMTLLQGIPFAG
jgi:imidazolonepropionase